VIRTLQLAGVHGWVSLRLTVSRSYLLPRLTLSLIAGYMLLFFSRHFSPLEWGPVVTSFVVGFSCVALTKSEINSRTLPLPLPQAWLTAVSVIAQLLVCVAVAIGYMAADIVTSLVLSLGMYNVDFLPPGFFNLQIPHLLTATELGAMALMLVASLPIGLSVVSFGTHIRQPGNAWPERRWQDVIPPLYALTVALSLGHLGAQEVIGLGFAENYLYLWRQLLIFITSIATVLYILAVIFPPSTERVREAKPAMDQLMTTAWKSQAIKFALMLVGLTLYMLPHIPFTPVEYSTRLSRGLRPLLICYAALIPFFSMVPLTSGQSTSGTRQFLSSWDWSRSGWRVVPAARASIQRTLLLDMVGFATVSSLLLHGAVLLAGDAVAANPAHGPWAEDLTTFAWYFIWFTGISLPAMLMFYIPRRRFGLFLPVLATGATVWAFSSAFVGINFDLQVTLPMTQDVLMMVSWWVLVAVVLVQSASPAGRFAGVHLTRRVVAATAIIIMVAGVASHRDTMSTAIEESTGLITAEQTDRLIEDLRHIHDLGILSAPTRDRSAAPTLSPYIGLDDGSPAEIVAWWDHPDHKKKLLKLSKKQQKNGKRRWYDVPEDITIGDMTLLTELMAFDHWESGRAPADIQTPIGKYEQHLTQGDHATYLSYGAPFPNLVALFDLARFRLLHGLRTGDMLPALTEVRHLAKLLHSDETLVSTLSAVHILRLERQAVATAVDRELLDPMDWTPVSKDDANTMTRAAVGMSFVLSGGADEAQWRRVFDLPFAPFGLCGSIHEAMTTAQSVPNFTLWPGELFPEQNMDAVDHAIAQSDCKIPLTRADRKTGKGEQSQPTERTFSSPEWHRMLSRELGEPAMLRLSIPYLRGPAWMDTQYAKPAILMYGDTPEDDWRGNTRK